MSPALARVACIIPAKDEQERIAATVTAALALPHVDVVLVCAGLHADLPVRRVERLLTLAWDSGATPVLVLTKADLCADPAAARLAATRHAPGVDVAWANEPLPLLGVGPVAPLWVSLAVADFGVKLAIAAVALLPFRLVVARVLARG